MKFKRLIAAVMAVTTMVSTLSVNVSAKQPEVDLSTSGAIYYDENTSTDVEIITSRIVDMNDKNYNSISLNVGAKVSFNNIFKLADGYDFDDFTYECSDRLGDKLGRIKIIKSSGKYYLKAEKEGIGEYLRVFYKKKLIASISIDVNNDYKSASKVTVSNKNPKIGEEITLKSLTSNNKYATCCWIIVGDSSWELPAAWYTNWNREKSEWGKITLSFNDFGKVKIYCLSPNGRLKKVKINISEEVYDTSINYPDKTWFYDKSGYETVGYIKSDGSVVITNENFESYASTDSCTFAYSWEKKCFYEVHNKGTSSEKISWWDDYCRFSLDEKYKQ